MYLRTTTLNTTNAMLNYMTEQEATYNKLSQDSASGSRIHNISDDPSATRNVLNINTKTNQLQAYLDNMKGAAQELTTFDDSMSMLTNLLNKTTDLAEQGANGTYSNENLDEIKAQVDSIIDSIINISNTDYNGKYIFSGANTETPAYTVEKDADGVITSIKYNGTGTDKGMARQVTISDGVNVSINVAGSDIFGSYDAADPASSKGLFSTLMSLSKALGEHNQADVTKTLDGLNAGFENAVSKQTKMAAVSNKFDITTTSINSTMSTLEEYRSSLKDTDLATSLTKLVAAQTALKATYSITSDMMKNVGLLNYL